MSSAQAMKKYAGGVANYRASEGKSVLVPYRGSVMCNFFFCIFVSFVANLRGMFFL